MAVEFNEIESKVKEIVERMKAGTITLGELGAVFGEIGELSKKLGDRLQRIEHEINNYREIIRGLEKEKEQIREQMRDMNVLVSGVKESIQTVLGFTKVSKVTGTPVLRTGGKGQRVYVQTTEAGVKAGLVNVAGEFESMAKAVYSLFPSLEGKRMDFKKKLLTLQSKGFIELEFY
jgi:DNA repair exonuclease SbcCD ATPase subunit